MKKYKCYTSQLRTIIDNIYELKINNMTKEYNYWVEVRQEIGWPEGNYTEEHYEFDTKKEALTFARQMDNQADTYVHNVYDYETVQRNYDPIDITNEI